MTAPPHPGFSYSLQPQFTNPLQGLHSMSSHTDQTAQLQNTQFQNTQFQHVHSGMRAITKPKVERLENGVQGGVLLDAEFDFNELFSAGNRVSSLTHTGFGQGVGGCPLTDISVSTEDYSKGELQDAYMISCAYSRARGLYWTGALCTGLVLMRLFCQRSGIFSESHLDEIAPLRNSPIVISAYAVMGLMSMLMWSLGHYSLIDSKTTASMGNTLQVVARTLAPIMAFSVAMLISVRMTDPTPIQGWYWFLLGSTTVSGSYMLSALHLSFTESFISVTLLLSSTVTSPEIGPVMWGVPGCGYVLNGAFVLWGLRSIEQNHRNAFLSEIKIAKLEDNLQVAETAGILLENELYNMPAACC